MNRDEAQRELDVLLREPGVLRRWPDGLTTDDVLAALESLGRLILRGPAAGRGYGCRVETDRGGCGGEGLTLTAAALRCFLEAEAEVAAFAGAGIERLEALLATRNDPDPR